MDDKEIETISGLKAAIYYCYLVAVFVAVWLGGGCLVVPALAVLIGYYVYEYIRGK